MQQTGEGWKTPLATWILDKIARDGAIRFRDYMSWCLYHPTYGYYMQNRPVIGKDGDYYTVSSIGSLMGEMVAEQCVRFWESHPSPSCLIMEWGGGTGRLAGQVLDALADAHPVWYERVAYRIIDRSPRHRALHDALDKRHAGKWRSAGPEDAMSNHGRWPEGTIVFSNELLDAFPVHRVKFDGSTFLEQMVTGAGESGFTADWRPIPRQDALSVWLDNAGLAGKLAPGQLFEVNLEAEAWLAEVAARLADGMVLTIDYGEEEEQLFSPARRDGTLMCYRKHRAHDNPFIHAGEQDITAHVNFSALMRAGEIAGLRTVSFETQRDFMLRLGIMDRLVEHAQADPFHPVVRRNRAIRQLLVGDRMGDVFKVLIQQKDG